MLLGAVTDENARSAAESLLELHWALHRRAKAAELA
jgi:hypothetical protein